MLESTRAKEAEVKKETTEQLEAFRKRQEEAEKEAKQGTVVEDASTIETTWNVAGRKRKKTRSEAIGGIKLRKTSSVEVGDDAEHSSKDAPKEPSPGPVRAEIGIVGKLAVNADPVSVIKPAPTVPAPADSKPATDIKLASGGGLGLGAYSSDEE